MTGQTISHYRILEKLGEGGMGVVYKAEDIRLGRIVALKFLHDHSIRSADSRKRFEREAKAAALLNHPNICTIYEIDEIDDRLFIAMAWAPGESLASRIQRGPLPVRDALSIAMQCAAGLQEAHANGIVHRDLKPSNIFLTPRAESEVHALVMDFGVALLASGSSLTHEGAVLGTVGYMSPEQTTGAKLDQRTDVWALGVVLYEMLVGRSPFEGEYKQAVAYMLVNEPHQPVTALRTGMPIEIDRVLDKALAKSPEDRYQDMADLNVDLRQIARSAVTGTGRTTTLSRSAWPAATAEPGRRSARSLGLAGAAGAAAALVAMLLLWLLRPPPAEPLSGFQLTQVTRDAGLSMTPALSPDGNLAAYASDRDSPGALNLWIQQVAGGGAVQLTSDPAADYSPAFSPDGGRIAFRSERQGGGVYLIPSLGGEARLAAAGGRRPRFSPDGLRLAYYTAPPSSIRGSRVFVASAEGGQRRALTPDFAIAAMPVWIQNGRRIAFWGAPPDQPEDVWILSPDSESPPERTGIAAMLGRQGLSVSSLDSWDSDASSLIFSAVRKDSINLWSVELSPDGTPRPPARRLTLGRDEREAGPPIGGKIAFTAGDRRINVWALPLNAAGEAPAGPPHQITLSAAADFSSVISQAGDLVIFRSSRSGFVDVWAKRLPGGQLAPLTSNAAFESIPRLSTDAERVAFSIADQKRRTIYAVRSDGQGATAKLCDDCGAPIAWTASGDLIYQTFVDDVSTFLLLHTSDGETEPLFSSTPLPVYAGSVSSDGKWLAFKGDIDDNRTQVYVTPFDVAPPIDPADWIEISTGGSWDDLPRFSPDSRLVYFTSDRDGFRCIWARRFDPIARRPVGNTFAVTHFHSMDLSLSGLSLNEFELSVGPGQLVFPLLKQSGNIWMLEPAPAQTGL